MAHLDLRDSVSAASLIDILAVFSGRLGGDALARTASDQSRVTDVNILP